MYYLALLALAVVLVIALASFWKIVGFLDNSVAKMREWSARLHASGQFGAAAIGNILDGLIVIFVGIILVFNFIPQIESNSSTANITNPTTKTFGDMLGWLLPVLAIIGLLYVGIRMFIKKKGAG